MVAGYHLNYLDGPVFMAGPKPTRTDFGIRQRLESCVESSQWDSVFLYVLNPQVPRVTEVSHLRALQNDDSRRHLHSGWLCEHKPEIDGWHQGHGNGHWSLAGIDTIISQVF